MHKLVLDTPETLDLNGEVYAVNDHVYVSSPWNASDGAPWVIGRIMEFIRESGTSSSSKRRKTHPIIQFKLAHYHRQRDLNSRHILDCRLLEASMASEVFCVTRLRGKCRVEFKTDRNADEVEGWKSRPDCFYFSQVYGRFTHRHYDLILTQNVKNAPPEVLQFLRNSYSYIFAEPGMGAELTEERRGCVSCKRWTTGSDSVTCALCNGAYHFTCLNPPLIRKPERGHRWARGYQWACAPCSKKRHDSIEDQVASITKNSTEEPTASTSSSGPGVAGSGRSLRDKVTVTALVQPGNGPDGVLRTVDGWPFRYYGQYTEPTSVLDPMDSPHLYTAPRIGSRFQTTVPAEISCEIGTAALTQNTDRPTKVEKRSRDGTPINVTGSISSEVDTPRGGDDTVDVIYTPELSIHVQESDVDNYIRNASLLPVLRNVGVSLVDQALQTLSQSSSLDEAYSKLTEQSVKSFGFAHWTEGESHRMDTAIAQLGDDLRAMLKLFPKKNWADITKFFYMFKGHKFPEISALDSRIDASVSQSPNESSSILPTPSSKRPYTCVVCELRSAPVWRRCPEALMAGATLAKKCLCDECYLRWKKYGLQHVPVAAQEDSHRGKERKSRGSYAKPSKSSVSKSSISAPSAPAPVLPAPPPTLPAQPSPTNSQLLPLLPKDPPPAPKQPPPAPKQQPPAPKQQPPVPARVLPPQCLSSPKELPLAPQTLPPPPTLPSPVLASEPVSKPLPKPLSKPLPKPLCKPSSKPLPKPLPKPLSPQSHRTPASNSRVGDSAKVSCTLCDRVEPIATLASCKNCTLACHIGCLGLDPNVNLESWKCLVCHHAESTAVSKVLCCSLCQSKPRYYAPREPFSALDVWKLSEYNSFVHMICAIWHAELTLGTPADLSRVEGFASIPLSKRKRECMLCHQSGIGACTKCDQCSSFVHVSCAWSAGYKFGFEILPQKKRRPRERDLVKYGEHNGLMEPRIWCQEHLPTPDRATCDASDLDPLTRLTALQTFLQHQKDVACDPNLKILRKARRLDSVLDSVTKPKHASPATTIWGKSLDLEDGYMVSALSLLPESCETLQQDSGPAASTRQRKSSYQGSIDESSTGAAGTRVRSKGRAGNPGRNESRSAPRVIDQSDTPGNEVERNDISQSSHIEGNVALDSPPGILPPRAEVLDPPLQIVNSPTINPTPSTHSRAPKSKNQYSKRASGGTATHLKSNGPDVLMAPERSGKPPTNGPTVENSRNTQADTPIVKQPVGSSRSKSDILASSVIPLSSSHTATSASPGPGTLPEAAPVIKPPSKLRLTIKPAHAHQQTSHLPAPSQIQPAVLEPSPNHILSAPTFSYLPPPSLTLPQPPRPLSSSSSSSSPSSSSKPMMTRLPPINHLDVFTPSIPRLHPLPPVATTSSMYLPSISSVTQPPRRQPLPTTLPPPLPLLPARHQSPTPLHIHHPPTHFRFTAAPLSTPPSFDVFARAAAATPPSHNLQRVPHTENHLDSTDTSSPSHPKPTNKNSSSVPPRQNIST